jgi:hypothetical protein
VAEVQVVSNPYRADEHTRIGTERRRNQFGVTSRAHRAIGVGFAIRGLGCSLVMLACPVRGMFSIMMRAGSRVMRRNTRVFRRAGVPMLVHGTQTPWSELLAAGMVALDMT